MNIPRYNNSLSYGILEVFKLNTIIKNGNNNIIITSILMALLTYISNFVTNTRFRSLYICDIIDNIKSFVL